jgi:7-cyano-7-deazaguanine synthase
MKQTVVPARNMIFASVLAGLAASTGADEVWMGMHAGDRAIYPDCRIEFVRSMCETIVLGTGMPIRLITPFVNDTKRDILKIGLGMAPPVPYHLTRTCYSDRPVACGRCGSCQERLESFKLLGLEDPLEYASREIMKKE